MKVTETVFSVIYRERVTIRSAYLRKLKGRLLKVRMIIDMYGLCMTQTIFLRNISIKP